MNKIYLEIREAEGGADARDLINEMGKIYKKACDKQGFTYKVLD